MKKSKFYIYYVVDSSPKLKEFKTKKSMNEFIKKFKDDPENGYWIDFAFSGEFIKLNDFYELETK